MPSLAHFRDDMPSGGQIQSSGTLRNNMNAIYQGDTYPLKVVAQDTPDDTVKVLTSDVGDYYKQVWLTPTQPLDFDEANSGAISEPTSNDRIALVSVNSAGALSWTYGTQASSPTPPDCPSGDLPLAYVYQRKNKTTIYNFEDDNGEDCYIYRDVRPALSLNSSGVFEYNAVNDVIRHNTGVTGDTNHTADFVFGSPQLDDDGIAGHDSRVFFDKSKGAFRAGKVLTTHWDNANIGLYSHAEGFNTKASGEGSHAEGEYTEASSSHSHAEGYGCVASGYQAHAEGRGTVASGWCSHSEGEYTHASGKYSHAEGSGSKASLIYQHAKAGGCFAVVGDAQHSTFVLRRETTDATPVMFCLDVDSDYLVLPASTTWVFHVFVVARSDAGVSAGYEFRGVIKRDGSNNTSLVGSVTKTVLGEDTSALDCNVSADDTNESLEILMTGKAATNIRWVATVHLTEVGY